MKFIPILQEYIYDGHWELDQLVDRAGVLILILQDNQGRQTKLSFNSYMAYRKLDEGDALLTMSAIRGSGGTAKYFYIVEESSFIVWFNKERCIEKSNQKLIHCTVAAENDIIDIITFDLPLVEIK